MPETLAQNTDGQTPMNALGVLMCLAEHEMDGVLTPTAAERYSREINAIVDDASSIRIGELAVQFMLHEDLAEADRKEQTAWFALIMNLAVQDTTFATEMVAIIVPAENYPFSDEPEWGQAPVIQLGWQDIEGTFTYNFENNN